tara:strand:- start:2853 stop:3614 length:762 start_codon:yes stop_codon:yes gene_type:complete
MIEKQIKKPLDSSVDAEEIEKFSALADEWWNPEGSFKPLHKLNPTRLKFIRDRICERFERDPNKLKPFEGIRIADIGCGGGLLTEPIARLGANVTGLDASEKNILAARNHAERMGLQIDYRYSTVEAAVAAGETYDVVLNMEVVEHVTDADEFLQASSDLVAAGGCMFVATLNRTVKSFAFAIVGAEYIMRWLPRGTHDWRKFQRPSEITANLRQRGLTVKAFAGLRFDPIRDRWRVSSDLSVNYMGYATRAY